MKVARLITIFFLCLVLTSCSSTSSDYQAGYDAGYADGYAAALEQTKAANVQAAIVDVLPTEPSYDYYVVNKKSKKFHIPSCASVDEMKEANKIYFSGTKEELIENGYDPRGNCNP